MCYRPVTINNPSKHFDIEHDKAFLTVPCGKCGECRNKKRVDMQVRTYYEYLHCTQVCGGYCLFVTLTYNEASLPRLFGIPCFNYEDIKLFFKRLRSLLKTRTGLSEQNITYIVAEDYGDERLRPHYHLLIFFNNPKVSEFAARAAIRDAWAVKKEPVVDEFGDLVTDHDGKIVYQLVERIGFIKFGDNLGRVDRNGAIKYTTKYVCKPIEFEERFKELYNVDDAFIKHSFAQYLPKYRASVGFGLYALECTSDDLLLAGKIKCPSVNGEIIVPLPLYLERKKFFDVVQVYGESPRYRINSAGIYARSIRFPAIFEAVQNHIDNVVHNRDYIAYMQPWLDAHNYDSPYKGIVSQYASPLDVLNRVINDPDFDIASLSEYLVVYRGFIGRYIGDFDGAAGAFQYHIDTNYTIYDVVSRFDCECCANNNYDTLCECISLLSYIRGRFLESKLYQDYKRLKNYKRAVV